MRTKELSVFMRLMCISIRDVRLLDNPALKDLNNQSNFFLFFSLNHILDQQVTDSFLLPIIFLIFDL